jgi:hypothetical protein
MSANSIPPAQPEGTRRAWYAQRVRLGTFLLLMAVVGLLLGLNAQCRREAGLRAALASYRDPKTEAIIEALTGPDLLSVRTDSTLEDVLKELKLRTVKTPNLPKFAGIPVFQLAAGIPIYVDPLGLQEAQVTLTAKVKQVEVGPSANRSLGGHLRQLLDSVGLGYQVKDGFLMITSKESLDPPTEDVDPYLQYRDVLR